MKDKEAGNEGGSTQLPQDFARVGDTPIDDAPVFNGSGTAIASFVNSVIQAVTYMQILRSLVPPVHRGKPYGLLENMRSEQMAEWWDLREGSLIIQVFGTNACNQDTSYVLSYLIEALKTVVGIASPDIATPNAPTDRRHFRPSSFLLKHPAKDAYNKLVQQFVWSTTPIAFFVYEMIFTIPRFIGSFQGFTTVNTDIIVNAFKLHLNTEHTRKVINNLRAENPKLAHLPLDHVMTALLDSIEVHVFFIEERDRPRIPVANLYMDSPTAKADQWTLWQGYLRDIEYTTQLHGCGVKRELWKCSGCHGDDHPRGLCPFPQLSGWMTRPFKFGDERRRGFGEGRGGNFRMARMI